MCAKLLLKTKSIYPIQILESLYYKATEMDKNCYAGRIGVLNSGGESKGESDFKQAIKTAVINKRAGGSGIIMGRKAFQRPFDDGVKIIKAVQDIYLAKEISIA
jgi:class I fructose-bisphosphate aldolase